MIVTAAFTYLFLLFALSDAKDAAKSPDAKSSSRGEAELLLSGPHRMHDMRTIAIDDPGRLSVCLSRGFTRFRCAKTAKRTEIRFVVKINACGPRNFVFDGGMDPQRREEGDTIRPYPNYFGDLFCIK